MGRKLVAVGAFLAASLVVFACQPGGGPTAPSVAGQNSSLEMVSGTKQSKADVCHLDDEGAFFVISVADPAVPGHLGHGDHLVTDEVCGDGIDNDCDGQVDEGCAAADCPCGDAESIGYLFLRDPACSDAGGVLSLWDRESPSEATSSAASCSFTNILGTTTSSGHSASEASACDSLIREAAAGLFLSCSSG